MPDNDIGWGQGAVNNDIGWGKGATNNDISWGAIHADSPSGDTNLVGGAGAFTNTKSLSFDGIDDYASVASGDGWIGAFSWTAWVYVPDLVGYKSIYVGNQGVNRPWFTINNSVLRYFTGSAFVSSTSTITANNWHHVAITRNTSFNLKFYIDGIDAGFVGSTSNNVQYPPSTAYIGVWAPNLNLPFKGQMDELAFFDYELNGTQMLDIYNSGVAKDVSDLTPVNYWRFEDNGNDSGSRNNPITLINGTTFSTNVPS